MKTSLLLISINNNSIYNSSLWAVTSFSCLIMWHLTYLFEKKSDQELIHCKPPALEQLCKYTALCNNFLISSLHIVPILSKSKQNLALKYSSDIFIVTSTKSNFYFTVISKLYTKTSVKLKLVNKIIAFTEETLKIKTEFLHSKIELQN